MAPEQSRRRHLLTIGAIATSGLSGCASSSTDNTASPANRSTTPTDGTQTSPAESSLDGEDSYQIQPTDSQPMYQDWVPAQSETNHGPDDSDKNTAQYNINQINLPAVLQFEDVFSGDKPSFYIEDNDLPGLNYTESEYISAGPALGDSYFYMFDGGVTDREARVNYLTSELDASVVDTFNGYTIVSNANESGGAFAVSDTTELQTVYISNGPDVVRSAIQSQTPKIADTDRTCEILTGKLPDGEHVRLTFRARIDIPGLSGYGRTLQYGPETASIIHVSVYDPAEATMADIREYATSQVPENYRNNVETDGRTVKVTGEAPIEEFGYPR